MRVYSWFLTAFLTKNAARDKNFLLLQNSNLTQDIFVGTYQTKPQTKFGTRATCREKIGSKFRFSSVTNLKISSLQDLRKMSTLSTATGCWLSFRRWKSKKRRSNLGASLLMADVVDKADNEGNSFLFLLHGYLMWIVVDQMLFRLLSFIIENEKCRVLNQVHDHQGRGRQNRNHSKSNTMTGVAKVWTTWNEKDVYLKSKPNNVTWIAILSLSIR